VRGPRDRLLSPSPLSFLIALFARPGDADRWHVIRDQVTHPPVASFAALARGAEPVAIEAGADECGRGLRERIGAQQFQRRAVILEELEQERDAPGVLLRGGLSRKERDGGGEGRGVEVG